MGEYQYLRVAIEDRTAILTIDHPPANSFDAQTVQDLNDAFDEVSADSNVKVIIITGAGQFFSAGADINSIGAVKGYEDAKELLLKGQGVFNKIEASRKPVIAAINGRFALGGGNELAMSCHIRLAEDSVSFGQPECNLGVMPGWGGTQRLPRLIGKGKALELLLTGDRIRAQEAFRLGLVNKVVPVGTVVTEAKRLAKKLSIQSLMVTKAIIDTVNEGLDMDLGDGLLLEADRFARLCETEDMREGIGAFLEKRRPQFKDR